MGSFQTDVGDAASRKYDALIRNNTSADDLSFSVSIGCISDRMRWMHSFLVTPVPHRSDPVTPVPVTPAPVRIFTLSRLSVLRHACAPLDKSRHACARDPQETMGGCVYSSGTMLI